MPEILDIEEGVHVRSLVVELVYGRWEAGPWGIESCSVSVRAARLIQLKTKLDPKCDKYEGGGVG